MHRPFFSIIELIFVDDVIVQSSSATPMLFYKLDLYAYLEHQHYFVLYVVPNVVNCQKVHSEMKLFDTAAEVSYVRFNVSKSFIYILNI